MGNTLAKLGILFGKSIIIQLLAYAIAAPLQTEKFYDAIGSTTYLALLYSSLSGKLPTGYRRLINSSMMGIWALRLGSFLIMRMLYDGRDKRFDGVRSKPSTFLIYWLLQGVWAFITAMPVYLLNVKGEASDSEVTTLDQIGWFLWVLGFFMEVVADVQKFRFKLNPENKGKFITSGLWSISQHPNYAGEIMMWVGLFLSSANAFAGLEYCTVISPMFIYYLLRHMSGVPLLQRHGLKTWGSDPKYIEYIRNTSLLFPFLSGPSPYGRKGKKQ